MRGVAITCDVPCGHVTKLQLTLWLTSSSAETHTSGASFIRVATPPLEPMSTESHGSSLTKGISDPLVIDCAYKLLAKTRFSVS